MIKIKNRTHISSPEYDSCQMRSSQFRCCQLTKSLKYNRSKYVINQYLKHIVVYYNNNK